MRRFIDIISEAYQAGFRGIKGQEASVFRNPSSKEWKECEQYDEVRAFIVGNDLLIWNPFTALHQMVREELALGPDAISITVSAQGREAYVQVTDNTRSTPWWHNPEVIGAIHGCGFLNKKFSDIEIGFYDEAIVGSWDELEDDDA